MFRRKVTLLVPPKQICIWTCHLVDVFYCNGYFANNWGSTTAHLVLYHNGYEAHVQHTVGCQWDSCRYGRGSKTAYQLLCLVACRHLAAYCHLVACHHLPPVVAVKTKIHLNLTKATEATRPHINFLIINYVHVELTCGQVTCLGNLASFMCCWKTFINNEYNPEWINT